MAVNPPLLFNSEQRCAACRTAFWVRALAARPNRRARRRREPDEDGVLIITLPRGWIADQRLAFMADVARALPRERWAHVGD